MTDFQSSSTDIFTIAEPLEALSAIILSSRYYPSFEREAIQPILGKVAVSLGRLLERCLIEATASLDLVVSTASLIHSAP